MKKKFTEPPLIKAGSDILGIGILKRPPLVDCRLVAEDLYQKMKKAYIESLS